MKRILLLSIIAISAMCYAADLSDTGRAHFKAAMALFEIASSNDDYKQVAQEFEAVTKSDPEYADTYLNLCKIYGRIGATDGNIYFTKAKEALEKYHSLIPNDIDTYNDEKVILETLQKKYKTSSNNITGSWIRFDCGKWTAFFPASITISEDPNTHDLIVKFIGANPNLHYPNSFKMSKSDNTISFISKTEYGRYTIGRGSITDHDVLVWHSDGSHGSNGGVSGYYPAYQQSKTASEECMTLYYRFKKIDNTLYVYFKMVLEYYDKWRNKIFYQGGEIEREATYTK